MSQERNHPVIEDMTGRVLSLEQRVKGMQGRIAAIEARLSVTGSGPVSNGIETEDFIPVTGQFEHRDAAGFRLPDDQKSRPVHMQEDACAGTARAMKPSFDLTGVIAGGIMIGAGVLLLNGNLEVIKNPLVAVGCGILLVVSAIYRKAKK